MVTPPAPYPFQQQVSGQIFKDDMNGFSSTSDICFMKFTEPTSINKNDSCFLNAARTFMRTFMCRDEDGWAVQWSIDIKIFGCCGEGIKYG